MTTNADPRRLSEGRRRAMIAKRTRCPRCNGAGHYVAPYRPDGPAVVSCTVCRGSGSTIPAERIATDG